MSVLLAQYSSLQELVLKARMRDGELVGGVRPGARAFGTGELRRGQREGNSPDHGLWLLFCGFIMNGID